MNEDIKKTFELIGHSPIELRAIDPKTKKVIIGTLDRTKHHLIDKQLRILDGTYNIYIGLHKRNHIPAKINDIISVHTIVFDVDPVRAKGMEKQASTEEEKNRAKKVAYDIYNYLKSTYYVLPSIAMSGNGYQVWIPIKEIQITDENRLDIEGKLKLLQKEIATKFSTNDVKIDNIGDLPRIIKLIGTMSVKGDNTSERPYRQSYWEVYNGRHIQRESLSKYILELTISKAEEKSSFRTLSYSIVEILEHLKYDDKFRKLFEGDWDGYPSRSEAEQALVCKLVYYGANESQIMEIMEESKIGKWQEKPDSYKKLTIKKAFEKIKTRWIPVAPNVSDTLAEKMNVEVKDTVMKMAWDEWFSGYTWNNPELSEAYMLLTISMIVKYYNSVEIYIGNNLIDPRVHLLVLQPAGTGKSQSMNAIKEVIKILRSEENIPLKVGSRTKITSDASITGTWRTLTSFEKKKLKDGEFVEGYDDVAKMVWVKGDLELYDMLFIGEASSVLTEAKTRDIREIQNTLLEAMSAGGYITKKKAETVEHSYYSRCCLALISRPTSEMIKNPEILLTSGMMRRCVPILQDSSKTRTLQDVAIFIEKINSTPEDRIFLTRQIKAYLHSICMTASRNTIKYIQPEAIQFVKQFVINTINESPSKAYHEFVRGSVLNYSIILSSLYSIIRIATEEDKNPIILEIDVKRACKFINRCLDSIMMFIEQNKKQIDLFDSHKKIRILLKILGSVDKISKTSLTAEMMRQTGMSKRTIINFLNSEVAKTYYSEIPDSEDKRRKWVKVKK